MKHSVEIVFYTRFWAAFTTYLTTEVFVFLPFYVAVIFAKFGIQRDP